MGPLKITLIEFYEKYYITPEIFSQFYQNNGNALLPIPENPNFLLPNIVTPVDDIYNWDPESLYYDNMRFLENLGKGKDQDDTLDSLDYNDLLKSYKEKKSGSDNNTTLDSIDSQNSALDDEMGQSIQHNVTTSSVAESMLVEHPTHHIIDT